MAKSKRGGAREAAFTDAQVLKIRELAKEGKTVAEIAEKLKARPDTTSRVVKGLSYKHLLPGAKRKGERKVKRTKKSETKKAA